MSVCGIITARKPATILSTPVSPHLLPVVEALAAAVPVLAVAMEVPQAEVVPAVAVYLMRRLYLPAVPVLVLLVRRAIKMCIGSQFPGRVRSRFIARVARTHMASC